MGVIGRASDGGQDDGNVLRPVVRGKFLFLGDKKFFAKGVTYGAFLPRADGAYHDATVIESDFAQMAANGINTVRIPHTVPPRSLLDAAQRHGLRIMVGLSAEQFVGYLIDRKKDAAEIERLILQEVERCAGHPALLCYALGNEIPAALVRYLGRHRVERFLRRLYHAVKSADPHGLVTYANYPSTEYLHLPWLDLVCFNVYLETEPAFTAYLARLQNLADDRPLLMGELGLDSLRHGEATQAEALEWQLRTAFRGGCAGAFVFSWTDEWYRSGAPTEEWSFGLTSVDREPKPGLAAVRRTFAEAPFPEDAAWPRISVIICTHNGSSTLRECLAGVAALNYPAKEVIVVDDGSTDGSAEIARQFDLQIVTASHVGLSAARNLGLAAATGEIVAYLDDDAWPDPDWLKYLAETFRDERWAGVGGPNLEPPGDGPVADSVANSPGGPVHVLLSDIEAEHLPGCNMAFRKTALEAVGGFDSNFRTAGDDVDICWSLQTAGFKLGFSPAAVVWHHARSTVAAYWKQQYGYGKAEALLEGKWPEKYNRAGHPTWLGHVYGRGAAQTLLRHEKIYRGLRGGAPFQFVYPAKSSVLGLVPTMPEWYLSLGGLALLSVLGLLWSPLLLALPLLLLAGALSIAHAGLNARRAVFPGPLSNAFDLLPRRFLVTALHLLQPLARWSGRLDARRRGWRNPDAVAPFTLPLAHHSSIVRPDWEGARATIQSLENDLRAELTFVRSGGSFDAWDLEARGGILGGIRIVTAIEDIAPGGQMTRIRLRPWWPLHGLIVFSIATLLALSAALAQAWLVAAFAGFAALGLFARAFYEAGTVYTLVALILTRRLAGSPR